MMQRTIRTVALATAATAATALTAPAALAAQESYSIRGDRVAIYNLAGEVEVVGGGGGDVEVRVSPGGADADRLEVRVDEIRGRQTLRVIYPSDRVVYAPSGWHSDTELRVGSDGTWGDDWGRGGDRVRVTSRGSGLEAHADLRIEVPRGQEVDIYLAVGHITASNVDGRVRLDTHSGGVEARDMAGFLYIDTGSGGVDVSGMNGDLGVDTGSGSVTVSGVSGDELGIDTGSGGVDADNVRARRIEIDTGSGSIELRSASARELRLDTGSGSVRAELTEDVDRLDIDTGSGGVTVWLPEDAGAELDIESGSGGIDVDFPVMATRRSRDELRGSIGDGNGRIKIDTGSGSIRIRRL